MNIGEKIKRIHQHRRMTQKELGELVDLSANRIAQYEMGYRVPKKPLLNQIAGALRVSPLALSDGGNGPANDILEQLFWLDEEQPGDIATKPLIKTIPNVHPCIFIQTICLNRHFYRLNPHSLRKRQIWHKNASFHTYILLFYCFMEQK